MNTSNSRPKRRTANNGALSFEFISTDSAAYARERELRAKVLREPLGMPPGAEIFPFEDEALHLVARVGDDVVGCVMFKPEGKTGRMLQMAVAQGHQKNGIGTELVKTLEERLRHDGFHDVYAHARDYAVPFYEHLGYSIDGKPFTEIGIRHFLMRKAL